MGLPVPEAPGTYQSCFPNSTNSGLQTNSAASGTVTANFSASATGNNSTAYSGTAAGVASFVTQSLGAQATGATTSNFNGAGGNNSAAFGLLEEQMTFTSPGHPSGTGSVKFIYSVDGSVTITNDLFSQGPGVQPLLGFAANQLELGLTSPNGVFEGEKTLFHLGAALQGNSQQTIQPSAGSTVTFSATGVSITTQATVVSAAVPIIFGDTFDFSAALTARAVPEAGGSAPGTVSEDFLTTAALTGIELFDANGNPITNFVIDTDAGVELGPDGVITASSTVPEPSALLLLAPGLAALALRRRRRAAAAAG